MEENVKYIDFNIDLGQINGVSNTDAAMELIEYVSSVNISCGFHSGDPLTIKEALLKAKEKNVAGYTAMKKAELLNALK